MQRGAGAGGYECVQPLLSGVLAISVLSRAPIDVFREEAGQGVPRLRRLEPGAWLRREQAVGGRLRTTSCDSGFHTGLPSSCGPGNGVHRPWLSAGRVREASVHSATASPNSRTDATGSCYEPLVHGGFIRDTAGGLPRTSRPLSNYSCCKTSTCGAASAVMIRKHSNRTSMRFLSGDVARGPPALRAGGRTTARSFELTFPIRKLNRKAVGDCPGRK